MRVNSQWGSNVPPPENFWLKLCKSCNFSKKKNKHRNVTFMEARESVYYGRKDTPFLNMKVIRFFQIYILCIQYTGEQSELEKK